MARRSVGDYSHMLLDDLQGDPALAQALGDMIVAWSAAERALLEALQNLTGTTIATAHTVYFRIPTFESRVKMIQALASEWRATPPPDDGHYRIDPDPEELKRIVGKLSALSLVRNGWVHGSWTYAPHMRSIYVLDHREPLASSKRRRATKAGDVRTHIHAVRKAARELRWIASAMGPRSTVPEPQKRPAKSP